MSEQPEQIDLSVLFASVLEAEGGEYHLPYDAYVSVSESNNKAISITPTDDGVTILLQLVTLENEDGQSDV